MSFKIQSLLNICMVTISWLSLYFIGVKNIKRFLPATLIIGIIEILHAKLAKTVSGGFFIISQTPIGSMNCLLILVHLFSFPCGH